MHDNKSLIAALESLLEMLHSMPDEGGEEQVDPGAETPVEEALEGESPSPKAVMMVMKKKKPGM